MESEEYTFGCFGKDFSRSSDLGSRSDVSVEGLDVAEEKRTYRNRREKGYAHLQRPSSEEELVFVRSKPKKTKVFGKLKDRAKEKEVKNLRSKSKSKSRGRELTPPVSASASTSVQQSLFGLSLSECLRQNPSYDNVPVPAIVRQCIDFVNDKGLNVEGIYKVSPAKNIVEGLRESVVCGRDEEVTFHDVHCATCVLKMFVRQLPETLFTAALVDTFEKTVEEIKNIAECLGRLNELIERLPQPNRYVLAYFFLHIQNVIKMQDVNKMTITEMSTVLQPVFNVSAALLNIFLQNAHLIFPNILPKKYVSPLNPNSSRILTELKSDPRAIREELSKQESLLSHLHYQLKAGVNDPEKEEQLWDVQRLVTQLKRELKALKKKEKLAVQNGSDAEDMPKGPCLEMFEEKQLLALQMELKQKVERERKAIEALKQQIRKYGPPQRTKFTGVPEVMNGKPIQYWIELSIKLNEEKNRLIDNIILEKQRCASLRAQIEMLSLTKQKSAADGRSSHIEVIHI